MSASRYPTEPAVHPEHVFSVTALTLRIKDMLENEFPAAWVAGEISNFSRPASGHCYLTLKDDGAVLRAVIWRATASRLTFDLEDGLEVVCLGDLEVYPPRGGYQLVIRQIFPKGVGALELALRKLRERLAAEGLFDPSHKRPLPRFPRRIAIVTSPTGAAIRDFLQVLGRRWRGADVLIVPAKVQGEGAAEEIARAIDRANTLSPRPDVLVVARGGGSLEDLWAFNEETVVRAIYRSTIPTISAVGHEIDVTLSDLVADVRALTPSEAAELVAPPADALAESLRAHHKRLARSLVSRATFARQRIERLLQRRALRKPLERIRQLEQRLDTVADQASRAALHRVDRARRKLEMAAARLESLSPLGVLARGYSITQRHPAGDIVRRASDVAPGDQIATRLASGRLISRVEQIEPEAE